MVGKARRNKMPSLIVIPHHQFFNFFAPKKAVTNANPLPRIVPVAVNLMVNHNHSKDNPTKLRLGIKNDEFLKPNNCLMLIMKNLIPDGL